MKILFCGSVLPEEAETKLQYLSNAGNRFQQNLINALKESGHDVFVCSYIGFPVEQDYLDELEKFHSDNQAYVFKDSEGVLGAVSVYRRKCSAIMSGQKIDMIMCYNPIYAFSSVASLAGKRNIPNILILADHSGVDSYTSFSPGQLKGIIRSYLEQKCIRKFDRVVGLSGNVAGLLRKGQLFQHIEGGLDMSRWENFQRPETGSEIKNIMYGGLLSKVAGVDIAINAFRNIPDDHIRLHITGNGDMVDYVKEQAGIDKRIIFHGRLQYEEYLGLLQQSHILLNPRNMNLPENRNNFPSKMLEYIATGRVIVSSKFAGWQDFEQCAFFTDMEDFSGGMKKALAGYDEIAETVFESNRAFAKDFDWKKQAEKILRLENYDLQK